MSPHALINELCPGVEKRSTCNTNNVNFEEELLINIEYRGHLLECCFLFSCLLQFTHLYALQSATIGQSFLACNTEKQLLRLETTQNYSVLFFFFSIGASFGIRRAVTKCLSSVKFNSHEKKLN